MPDVPQEASWVKKSGCLGSLASLILLATTLGIAAYLFPELRQSVVLGSRNIYTNYFPCSRPETYVLGTFDERFNVSREDFASAVTAAEAAWETAAGRDLFTAVSPEQVNEWLPPALTVNLVYDTRQEATDTLLKLGVTIDRDKAGYDRLKAEHDELVAQYERRKEAYAASVAAHDRRVDAYEAEVAEWNRKGGAPANVYERLNRESAAIRAEASALNRERDELNAMVDRINANVSVLNRLAATVNATADTYNDVSGERGDEFEEGLFTGTTGGGTVDIFEFDTRERLIRLLTHEMGHALGLEHVAVEGAIMYRLNTSKADAPTEADVAELRRVCKL